MTRTPRTYRKHSTSGTTWKPSPEAPTVCEYTGHAIPARPAGSRGMAPRFISLDADGNVAAKGKKKLAREAMDLQGRITMSFNGSARRSFNTPRLRFTDEARALVKADCWEIRNLLKKHGRGGRKERGPERVKREANQRRRADARKAMRSAYCCPLTGLPVPQDSGKTGRGYYVNEEARLVAQWLRRFKVLAVALAPYMTEDALKGHAGDWWAMSTYCKPLLQADIKELAAL